MSFWVAKKMAVSLDENGVVNYHVQNNGEATNLNGLIGKKISLHWVGNIWCQDCGGKTKKSFGEGLCYNCFMTSAKASECIIRPEMCQAHLGIGRDLDFEEKNHNQPHVVYLAATNSVKVGVTGARNKLTRWIDQGAERALVLAEVPYRQLAGLIEVAMKEHFTDKTNWQKMLTNVQNQEIDLVDEKWRIAEQMPQDIQQYWSESDEEIHLNYPVVAYPKKVVSTNFDKSSKLEGELTGIRGQYLYLNGNEVLNVRRHTGYELELIW
jgi:hypothetical protein